jgi:hypothetical protein
MRATEIHPKVAAAAGAGIPLAIVLAWLAGLAGVDMTPEVAAALAGTLAAVAGYLTPSMRAPRTNRRRHASPGDAGQTDLLYVLSCLACAAVIVFVVWWIL